MLHLMRSRGIFVYLYRKEDKEELPNHEDTRGPWNYVILLLMSLYIKTNQVWVPWPFAIQVPFFFLGDRRHIFFIEQCKT